MTTANLNKATATNYKLALPVLPSETTLEATRELTLNIYGTVIPSVSLDQNESRWQGHKMLFHAGGITFDTWSFQFSVDSAYGNWATLYNWLTYIANNYDTPSGLPADYMVDCALHIADNFGNTVMKITFKNTWIMSLGEVTLSQREGENTVESSATLAYDRFEIVEV